MIKPHEFLWKKAKFPHSGIKIQSRHAMRKCEINPNDILEKLVLLVHCSKPGKKDNKKQFFYVSLPSDDVHCSWAKFFLRRHHPAPRTTPDECASVGSHYVHVIMLCLGVSLWMYNCTRRRKKCCNKAKKRSCCALDSHSGCFTVENVFM